MENVILLTGFGSFGNIDINPSSQIAENLKDYEVECNNSKARVQCSVLPVVYATAKPLINKMIDDCINENSDQKLCAVIHMGV
eukprot:Pgem_evm1s20159